MSSVDNQVASKWIFCGIFDLVITMCESNATFGSTDEISSPDRVHIASVAVGRGRGRTIVSPSPRSRNSVLRRMHASIHDFDVLRGAEIIRGYRASHICG